MKHKIPIEYIRECFTEVSGRLFWKKRPVYHFYDELTQRKWNTRHSGKEAGTSHEYGKKIWGKRNRVVFVFNGKTVGIFRYNIIWALYNNEWPEIELDHENRDQLDDKIENLRHVTSSQNRMNSDKSSQNTSGYVGVNLLRNGKWQAKIKIKRNLISLGCYETFNEAVEAKKEAELKYFGSFRLGGYLDKIKNIPKIDINNIRKYEYYNNRKNRKPNIDNKSGYRGVHQRSNGTWRAYIGINGDKIRLGTYDTLEEAVAIRKSAEEKYFQ